MNDEMSQKDYEKEIDDLHSQLNEARKIVVDLTFKK